MATKAKKAPVSKGKATESKTGAGAAMAERSKDAKATFGKAAPKTVKPEAAAKPAASAKSSSEKSSTAKSTAAKSPSPKPAAKTKAPSDSPSIAKRVMRKVKETATGAVAMAASVIGKDEKKPRAAKSK